MGIHGVTFIYVGRLWWGKGINHLIEAFHTVQQQSEETVTLMLVGDGPEESKLRQQCVDIGVRNVLFTGFKQKSELPIYYAIADVFVFPTFGDPYGLVVDEAMACSLPIISTDAAGEIHSRVEEGVNGYIVPSKDSAALANRMLLLAKNSALRKHMGAASAVKISDHTPEKWAEDFELIVRSVLDGRKPLQTKTPESGHG
jgi:glycosyltransferase involved in cell wall biosynthesis